MAADDGVGCNAARMPPAAAACDGSAAMHCCQRHWPWSRERRSLRPWSAAARCLLQAERDLRCVTCGSKRRVGKWFREYCSLSGIDLLHTTQTPGTSLGTLPSRTEIQHI